MSWQDELQSLCEAVIENTLTEAQRHRLEELVVTNAEARKFYVAYMHQHGSLHWSSGDPSLLQRPSRETATPAPARSSARRRWLVGLATLAAAVMVAVGGWLLWPAKHATLASSKGCKWEEGTLPTETGARLGPGRLRLAEGIAKIVFDHGAEVTLEAPAEFELINGQRCILHAGRLVARVPHAAIGFTVDTPTALFVDQGTEFGVNVRDAKTSELQVFDGIVDAQHRPTGQKERLLTGRNRRYLPNTTEDFDPQKELPKVLLPAPPAENTQVVHISTAMGRGRDVYVQPLFPSPNSSEILLLVKNSKDEKSDFNRKAYIGMDLASLQGSRIIDAQLSLVFTPTGMGFASEVPDATFIVYGLTDESLDDWDHRTLRWKNAPANLPGGMAVDLDKVVKLGTFPIAQGAQQGERSISGPALTEFLNRNTNGLVTFIVVRETKGSGRADLVHGFANHKHPTLPPPTLKLTVAPK